MRQNFQYPANFCRREALPAQVAGIDHNARPLSPADQYLLCRNPSFSFISGPVAAVEKPVFKVGVFQV
jgi:hypothetical protein